MLHEKFDGHYWAPKLVKIPSLLTVWGGDEAFADLRHLQESDLGEKNGPERGKTARNRLYRKHPKSARTLANPRRHAGSGKKRPTG